MGILGNYLVTALRNFARHKLYSFINIVGLAVGLACAIFIILFIRDELSYDKWLPGTENLYRVETTFYFPGHGSSDSANTPYPVTPTLAAQIPEIAAQTHLIPERMTAKVGDRQFSEYVDVVDPNFFQIIQLPLVKGDPAKVFAQPESIVLSQAEATKYFGTQDPMGKTIVIDGAHPLTVTGVMRDLPHNTQLVADMAVPNTSKVEQLPLAEKQAWMNVDGEAFVRLAPGASPASVIAKTPAIFDKNVDAKKEMNVDARGSSLLQVHLTPFTDVHLKVIDGGMTRTGSWTVIYGFAAIALLILLIACFNFTNLATARAMMRAREVSLRKVMGARRRQLMVQFLGESVLTALLALALALALVEILIPAYDSFLNRPIAFNYATSLPLLLGLIGVAIFTGIIAGIYPALILSGFRPAATFRGGARGQAGSGALRTGLVVLQFAISIGLGIAAIVVFAQIRYAQKIDLGFQRDRMVVITGADSMTPAARDSFAHALEADPAIEGVSQSGPTPFVHDTTIETFIVPGAPQDYILRTIAAAPNFLKLYDMRLLAGRWLSLSYGNDVNTTTDQGLQNNRNILITQATVKRLGWTMQNAVGRTLSQTDAGRPTTLTVVGVVGDVMMDGIRDRAQAIVFYYNPNRIDTFSVRIKGGHVPEALSAIDSTWRRFAPTTAIRRRFLSDMFDRLFAADKQQGAMFGVFVGVAIFIACLGLFGLAAFTAERRTKEIGIRKTFGARTRDIVWLLLWQFSIPVVIANAIAWPVAYYYLHSWLESYAYRISLNPIYFAAAGLAALLIAWLTVAGHAVRVARANPIRALRYE